MRKVKSIKQLYEEVKNADLVITNDAPLNTALTKQINKPTLGSFALTSRLIGSKYATRVFENHQMDLAQIVLVVKDKLKLSLKESLHYTQNIFNILQYVGDFKEVEKYISKEEIKVLKLIEDLPTYQKAMTISNIDFLNKKDFAVIGENLFSNLDKKTLPNKYKSIDIFEKTKTNLDNFYLFNSTKSIVDRVVSMIDEKNQDSIAIVVNIEAEYLPLIKAKLINKNINLNEKIYLFQDFKVREVISILDSCFSIHNSKVIDMIEIANLFGIEISESLVDYDFLELVKIDSNAKKLFNLLEKLKRQKFEDILLTLRDNKIEITDELYSILNSLNLLKEKISITNLNDLKYYIENFDIEIDKNKNGVLLIDAKNSSYINRDIIFYVGMDHSWTKIQEEQKYFDKKVELEKNIDKFQILIQQGEERFFFVNKLTDSQKTIPPFYFSFIFDKKIESFEDELFNPIIVNETNEENIFDKKNNFQNIEKFSNKSSFSNSALSSYVSCPKKYSYSRLSNGAEKDYFLKGELVHSFAEFYLENAGFVKEKGVDKFVNLIMDELKYLTKKANINIEKNKIKFGLEAIVEFLDKIEINNDVVIKPDKETNMHQENFFAKKINKSFKSLNAEVEFKDTKLKLNGVIDLLANDSLIVDYKTGKKKSVKDIVKNSNISLPPSYCDFQPLVYLSIFRKFSPDKELTFKYSFPMMNVYNKLMDLELEENTINVKYIPISFLDHFITKEFRNEMLENGPKYAKPILEVIDNFSYFKNKEISTQMLESPELFAEKFEEEFTIYLIEKGMKPTKGNKSSVFKVLKSCFQMRIGEMYRQKEVYFFKDQIDIFEKFVLDKLDELNESYKTKFEYKPTEGFDTCDNCDFKSMCLKLGVDEVEK